MTDKMKCPFCGGELEKETAGDIETGRLVCCTKNCPVIDQNLFPDVWELLTVGKKAQDALKVAHNALRYYRDKDYETDCTVAEDALNEILSTIKRDKE